MSVLRSRRGVTLIELLVVLTILGVVTGIVGLAFRTADSVPENTEALAAAAAARREALSSRRRVTRSVVIDGQIHIVTALPDGSVLGDPGFGIERLSGRPRDAR